MFEGGDQLPAATPDFLEETEFVKNKLGIAVLSLAAAASVTAAPAFAAPDAALPPIDFGSLSAPDAPGGNNGRLNSANGVYSVAVTVSKRFGRELGPNLYNTSFAPWVEWSARDRSNAEVKGKNCQIEVAFPNTTQATYKSAACQNEVGFGGSYYKKPGVYSIVVTDRVSGATKTQTFTIE